MTTAETVNDPIPIWVPNEWNELKSAVIRKSGDKQTEEIYGAMQGMMDADMFKQVSAAFDQLRPELEDGCDKLARLLEKHGVQLHHTERTSDFSNNVWVRDILFAIRDQLFIACPSLSRMQEIRGIEHIKERVKEALQISEGVLEGGDIITLSNDVVLVGSQSRGVDFLSEQLQNIGIEMVHVPRVQSTYTPHLDCAIAPLPPRKDKKPNLLIRSESLQRPEETINSLRRHFHEVTNVENDPIDSLNMNIFWLNPETAISTPGAVHTNKKLRAMGYEVIELPYDDMMEAKGGIRCSIAPLERAR